MNIKSQVSFLRKLIIAVILMVLIITIFGRQIWGLALKGLGIGPLKGDDLKLNEAELELAKDFFNQYTQVISSCNPNKYNKRCVCGNLKTGSLNDMSIFAKEGEKDGKPFVNLSLLTVSIKKPSQFKKGMVKASKTIQTDYGSALLKENLLFVGHNKKFTQITNNGKALTQILMSNDNENFANKFHSENSDLYLVRNNNDPKIYNAYLSLDATKKSIFSGWYSCEFYSNLERMFTDFNKALNKSLRYNQEVFFSEAIPENYSITLTETEKGLNVSLMHFIPKKQIDTFHSETAHWETMDFVFYPKKDFYAYESAYQNFNVDYPSRLGNDACYEVKGQKNCLLKNIVLKDSQGYATSYRISKLTFQSKDGSYNVSKGYSRFIGGKWEALKKGDNKISDLKKIYFDLGDSNIGNSIIFADDNPLHLNPKYVTIKTFKPLENCHGVDSSCVDNDVCSNSNGKVFQTSQCGGDKVCCYLPCSGKGEECEDECAPGEDCMNGCKKQSNNRNLVFAMSGNEYSGYCGDGKICCKYQGNSVVNEDQKLIDARNVFANYIETIQNCQESDLGECTCGEVDTKNLGDYSILAVKGNDGVNLSLIPKIKSMDYLEESMVKSAQSLETNYGSLYIATVLKNKRNTQIYNDGDSAIISGSDLANSEFASLLLDKCNKLVLLRTTENQIANACNNNDEPQHKGPLAQEVDPTCEYLSKVRKVFNHFNSALGTSLMDNNEIVFSDKIPQNYSILVDTQKDGLDVSLFGPTIGEFLRKYKIVSDTQNTVEYSPHKYKIAVDTQKDALDIDFFHYYPKIGYYLPKGSISSVFYPKADFYAYEKAYYKNPFDLSDVHTYDLWFDSCQDQGNGKFCILTNQTVNSKNYRISGLKFYYNSSKPGFVVKKRYGLVSKELTYISDKTSLDAIYSDSGDNNIGNKIVFVNDESFNIGNNVTIATFNTEVDSCVGKGYSCEDTCDYEEKDDYKCDSGVCCFNECVFNGGVCVEKDANTGHCPAQFNGKTFKPNIVLDDLNDPTRSNGPVCGEEVCCQYV